MYGPETTYGWLPRQSGPRPPLNGCFIGEHFPTRWEEYALVLEALANGQGQLVVEAGTGFNPEIHVLSIILAREGWKVRAIDSDPATLDLPACGGVERIVESLLKIGLPDESADAYTCVSTLEHLGGDERAAAFEEAFRVLKRGGLAVVTADWLHPVELAHYAQRAGFLVGNETPHRGDRLCPDVSFVRAMKP